jgi:hypothetical protein
MSKSSTARTSPNRNPEINKTIFQNQQLCGNLQLHADWNGSPIFKNLVHDCRGFEGPAGEQPISKDSNGWPSNGWWRLVMSTGVRSQIEKNVVIRCKCETDNLGVCPVVAVAGCNISNQVKDADNVTWYFDLVVTGQVSIIGGVGNHPVRNLIIPQIGYDYNTAVEGSRFLPKFIKYISQYYGMRFMNFLGTDDGSNWDPTMGVWANRITPNNCQCGWGRYTPAGYKSGFFPIEYIIEMVNEASNLEGSNLKKIWLNTAHDATDEYVHNFYQMVYDNLNPDIIVYVECSNEVWNPIFPQFSYFGALGTNIGHMEEKQLSFDGNTDWNCLRARAHASRAYEVRNIIKAIWDTNVIERAEFRMIFAEQLVVPWHFMVVIEYIEFISNEPFSNSFYGISGAPYFNFEVVRFGNDTPEQIVAGARYNIENYITPVIKTLKNICTIYKVKCVMYETGYDYNNGEVTDYNAYKMVDALQSSLFESLMKDFLISCFASGADEMFYYNVNTNYWPDDNVINFTITDSIDSLSYPLKGFRRAGNSLIPLAEEIDAYNYLPIEVGDTSFIGMRKTTRKCMTSPISDKHVSFDDQVSFYNPYPPNYPIFGNMNVALIPTTFASNSTFTFGNSNAGKGTVSNNILSSEIYTIAGVDYNIIPDIRYVDLAIYVAKAGTYKFTMHGFGGSYLTYVMDTPNTTTGLPFGGTTIPKKPIMEIPDDVTTLLWDSVKDGDFKWSMYISDFESTDLVKIGEFEPPIVGNLVTSNISRTPLEVYLTPGFKTLRLESSLSKLCYTESGRVTSVAIENGGINYLSTDEVIFPNPETGGVLAQGRLYVDETGKILHIFVDNSGSNYTVDLPGYNTTKHYLPAPTIVSNTGSGFVGGTYIATKDNGVASTYKLDVFGNQVLDSNNNPIILEVKARGVQMAVEKLEIKRIA